MANHSIIASVCLLWIVQLVFCEFPSCLTTTPSDSISLKTNCKKIDTSVEVLTLPFEAAAIPTKRMKKGLQHGESYQVTNKCAESVRLYAFFEPIETEMRRTFYQMKPKDTVSIILSGAIQKWTRNGLLNRAAVVIYAWTNLKDSHMEQMWRKTLNGTLSCS